MDQPSAGARSRSILKSALILFAVIGGTIALGVLYLAYLTPDLDVEMSGAGTTAMILGALFSFVVAGALMGLVFFSNRRGHDDDMARRGD